MLIFAERSIAILYNQCMRKGSLFVESQADGLKLWVTVMTPDARTKPRGIVQFLHGMAEHQADYYEAMKVFVKEGYVCVVHDHRGHGKSVRETDDLGYFYEKKADLIVEDTHQISTWIKGKFADLPLYMVAHSMGTLVARKYLQKYDDELSGLVLLGAPSKNPLAKPGIVLAQSIAILRGSHHRSKFLDKLTLPTIAPSQWLSSNKEYLKRSQKDEACGFIYPANGYLNVARLSADAFRKRGWAMKNSELPILFLAGSKDPIIGDEGKWRQSVRFLEERGYKRVNRRMYPRLKHALLQDNLELVTGDIIDFLAVL
jgi:alpha-beta hydrolase superfamily lysophospholipase